MSTAFIWGASGGIGSALVTTLKNNGWTVYGAARQIDLIPVDADETFAFDASDPESYKEIALLLAQDAAQLDLVVYAAGGMNASTLERLGSDSWSAVMDANLNGAYLGIQSLLHLVPKGGHVMVIGAYVHKITLPKVGADTTAKAALEPMMTIYAKENRRKLFTLVRPPAVDSKFWDNVPFTKPDTALSPSTVADAILAHYTSGNSGILDL
jgi:3-oxoacyl-[acyl-carrier protein] reductase